MHAEPRRQAAGAGQQQAQALFGDVLNGRVAQERAGGVEDLGRLQMRAPPRRAAGFEAIRGATFAQQPPPQALVASDGGSVEHGRAHERRAEAMASRKRSATKPRRECGSPSSVTSITSTAARLAPRIRRKNAVTRSWRNSMSRLTLGGEPQPSAH